MTDTAHDIAGFRVLALSGDGPLVRTGADAADLMSAAWGVTASTVAVPVSRLDETFWTLSSGLAGEVTQKFVNYGLRLVVLGDISAWTAQSKALSDYVRESNRGAHIWFLADWAALETRLAA